MRRRAHAVRAGARVRASGPGESSQARSAEKAAGPVPTEQDHRSQARSHQPTRQSSAEPEGGAASTVRNQATQAAGQRLWKRRSLRELENPQGIFTFPQPQQQQTFGYISNVSTTPATVTFLNGLTGSMEKEFGYGKRALGLGKVSPMPGKKYQD